MVGSSSMSRAPSPRRTTNTSLSPPRARCRAWAAAISRFIRSDRKSTRLNSSHVAISYAVFCLNTCNTIIFPLSLHDALPIYLCDDRPVVLQQSLRLHRRVVNGRIELHEPGAFAPPHHEHIVVTAEGALPRLGRRDQPIHPIRSEEHTSELQSRGHLVCRLLLEYLQHHHLPSFPTRRSSDLPV